MGEINIPIIGNAWLVGIFALIHFALVSMGGLAPLVIYLAEGAAIKKGDERLRRLAKEFLVLVLEIAVIGGIFGSGTVVALIGLYPQVVTFIVNLFFWFLVLQLFAYIAGLGFGFAYYFTWDKPEGRHRLWGLLAAILPLVPFIVFTAGTSFINNPGAWPRTGNILLAVFNPVTVPSLLHRAAAGLALIGALLVFLHLYRGRNKTGEERKYHDYAVSWAARLAAYALAAQVVLGILRFLVVRPEGRGMLLGSLLAPWLLGILMGMVALILFYTRGQATFQAQGILMLAALLVLGSVWFMGTTKALERGDFAIVRVMDKQGELVEVPAAYRGPMPGTGEAVFNTNCASCHPGLAGDAKSKARSRYPDPDKLADFLRNPSAYNISMPPFTGSDAELEALVSYLLGKGP